MNKRLFIILSISDNISLNRQPCRRPERTAFHLPYGKWETEMLGYTEMSSPISEYINLEESRN
jgi:hypothetical protein